MARKSNQVKYTSQYLDNLGLDETTLLPMTEVVGTDGTVDAEGNPNIYREKVASDGSTVVYSSDSTATGTLSVANDVVAISASNRANVDFQISYTSWTGQITFEGTVDGTNWVALFGYLAGTGQTKTSYQNPASGTIYRCTVAGLSQARVRLSNANTGTATINAIASSYTSGVFLNFPLPTGANVIGQVGIDQTTPGTTNAVAVNSSVLPTGAATSAAQTTAQTSLNTVTTDLDYRYAGGKSAYVTTLAAANNTTLITPAAGKRIQVYWVAFVPNSDNSAANLLSLGFGTAAGAIDAGSEIYRGYALAHWELFTGAADKSVIVNAATAQPVAITIHYKEIT